MSQPTTTSTVTSTTSSDSSSSNNNQVEAEGAIEGGVELPSTLEAALDVIKKLEAKRTELLTQKEKSTKEIEKLQKRTRMETLKSLIPRELFARSDTWEAELEKVYLWQGLSDKDISDIYQAKLSSIDSGKRVKQHSSSSLTMQDKYAHFKSIPQFHNAATKIQQAASDNAKLFSLMKKIAGSSNN
jgi:hypothetical protein